MSRTSETTPTLTPNDGYAAFVVGATGNVGAHLVDALLSSPRCTRVTVITRRPLGRAPCPKLRVVLWEDFDEALLVHSVRAVEALRGHHVGFCCLGASKRDMMGLLYAPVRYGARFCRVDHDYVVAIAAAARLAGVRHFSVISTPGADPDSWFAYTRIKGQMERQVRTLGFEGLSIFHPGTLVVPAKQRSVLMERVFAPVLRWLDPLMPRYRSTPVEALAMAMREEFERRSHTDDPTAIYSAAPILALARKTTEIPQSAAA